jgi:hypothetical protein
VVEEEVFSSFTGTSGEELQEASRRAVLSAAVRRTKVFIVRTIAVPQVSLRASPRSSLRGFAAFLRAGGSPLRERRVEERFKKLPR